MFDWFNKVDVRNEPYHLIRILCNLEVHFGEILLLGRFQDEIVENGWISYLDDLSKNSEDKKIRLGCIVSLGNMAENSDF